MSSSTGRTETVSPMAAWPTAASRIDRPPDGGRWQPVATMLVGADLYPCNRHTHLASGPKVIRGG
jgi:hypothetical protein